MAREEGIDDECSIKIKRKVKKSNADKRSLMVRKELRKSSVGKIMKVALKPACVNMLRV